MASELKRGKEKKADFQNFGSEQGANQSTWECDETSHIIIAAGVIISSEMTRIFSSGRTDGTSINDVGTGGVGEEMTQKKVS